MSATNKKIAKPMVQNEVGTQVRAIGAEAQLARMTLATMLWEDQFYVDGQTIAQKLTDLVKQVSPEKVAILATRARDEFKLRHTPLLLAVALARIGKLTATTLNSVIQRADEMGEFLSMYWKDGKVPIANQVKKGLAQALCKFNEYQLAKFDKNSAAVSVRDVLFLTHAKPQNQAQEALFKRIANKQLATPDTWETQLSAGADKEETFSRLMAEKKLGALAFLRNLRNMVQAGISESEIRSYAQGIDVSKVLPFRYVAAARIMPQFEDMLENMMLRSLEQAPKLPGKTVLLVDVSGSMFGTKVSAKSDLDRFDAAAALAMLAREICEEVEIYTFSNSVVRVAPRRGFALRDALNQSQPHYGTYLGSALTYINANTQYDRVIVFTDEATHDRVPDPVKNTNNYILNVASYQNGINNGKYVTITGFSEAVLEYIRLSEQY